VDLKVQADFAFVRDLAASGELVDETAGHLHLRGAGGGDRDRDKSERDGAFPDSPVARGGAFGGFLVLLEVFVAMG
jgi:hypothetical protein